MVQLSHPCMTTGETIASSIWTFVGKVMSLLFNMMTVDNIIPVSTFRGKAEIKMKIGDKRWRLITWKIIDSKCIPRSKKCNELNCLKLTCKFKNIHIVGCGGWPPRCSQHRRPHWPPPEGPVFLCLDFLLCWRLSVVLVLLSLGGGLSRGWGEVGEAGCCPTEHSTPSASGLQDCLLHLWTWVGRADLRAGGRFFMTLRPAVSWGVGAELTAWGAEQR